MKKLYSKIFLVLGFAILSISIVFAILLLKNNINQQRGNSKFFEVQSIDTMKYSRDLALESKNDPHFQNIINNQVRDIAATGATHIAIGTPYDVEFLPVLEKWVKSARENNLKVWFRGNFSGWEGWFNYPRIGRKEHIKLTQQFIETNQHLFEDGDIFTPCPECENGGPGDPRITHDVVGHRNFLIDEYKTTKELFSYINKNVKSNYLSMNGDVANLVMNRETTNSLDGIIVIDHYVKEPEKLISDINNLASKTSSKIVLGEFGAPIPDIHGEMSEDEQENYLNEVFDLITRTNNVIGINYWVNVGGSTQLWDDKGNPRKALNSIKKLYKPENLDFTLKNEANEIIKEFTVSSGNKEFTSKNGMVNIPFFNNFSKLTINSDGYNSEVYTYRELDNRNTVKLTMINESIKFKIEKIFSSFLSVLN